MTEVKVRKNSGRKVLRIFLKTILFLLLFVIIVFLLLLTPPVQRFITGKVENFLENKLQTRVEIERLSFGLSGKLGLKNIYLEDRTKDTLLYGGEIRTQVNLLKLLSNEIEIKDIEVSNLTAKVKRVLPDTVFNYQFVVDAFTPKVADTTTTSTPIKLSISDLALENIRLIFTDAVTGSDMFARIGNLSATFDSVDVNTMRFDIPSIIGRNITARINQTKPLVVPQTMSSELADAAAPTPFSLNLGTIDLSKIDVQMSNDVSAFYTTLNLGSLRGKSRFLDLQNNTVHLDEVVLENSTGVVRLGKSQGARLVEKEVEQEIEAQKTSGWDIRVARIQFNNNDIKFDNDNKPRLSRGLDYAHIGASDLTLHINDFVMNQDTVALNISEGRVLEKSGLNIQELQGQIMYANTSSYIRNLYVKTPGTELKRGLELQYASLDALANAFERTVFDVDIKDSRLQVSDILLFAPQLASNPALSNPSEIWYLNLVGNGTMDRLNIESLVFDGLRNTRINASGSLSGLSNPNNAGGRMVIREFRTSQTDIALFTGKRLDNAQMDLPETFTMSGTIAGNAGRFNTDMRAATSAGNLSITGSFAGIMSPNNATYDAVIRTDGLQLGTILRQQGTIGSVSGKFALKGRGLDPNNLTASLNANVYSLGYNKYQYHNINLNGTLRGKSFIANADVRDPNVDLNLKLTGNLSANPTFAVSGMIDSIKTLPLNLTTQSLVFRGAIDGQVRSLTPEALDASLLITRALFVSEGARLSLDTVSFVSGRNDTASFMRLNSDVANAEITGQYRLQDLGVIVQNSIQPYFTVADEAAIAVAPYDFRFRADVVYNPFFTAFMPALTAMEPLHAEGRFATGQGMVANVKSPYINYNGTELTDLSFSANTADSGLNIVGNVGHLKSGASFDVYNTRINALARNNVVDFSLGIDDANARNKYFLSGVLNQPQKGTYAVTLNSDSLLLNYELWNIPQGNTITISPSIISASDFTLSREGQQLSIASLPGTGQRPIQVSFTDFRLATITGFIKADSALADGVIKGNLTLQNITQQPAFTSDLTITDLQMRGDTVGNVRLQVNTAAGNRYNTNATITGRGNDIELAGYFIPSDAGMQLNLDLNVRTLQLSSLAGAMKSAIANPSGAINGSVAIRGTTEDPQIRGSLNFDQASFALTMLGSQFRIDNETLAVTNDGLAFDSFTIRDSANNALVIDGNILTSNFVNYNFNLAVTANNFMALNSTQDQNNLYYGKLNISSNLRINGTELKPVVDGTLTVNDGTDLFITVPQREPGMVEREGIVEFVDFDAPGNDSLFMALMDSLNTTDVKGMDIAVNIEVKKEAILNVVVDQANGDFLNVQGEALISAGVDPSGKITMAGNYTLETGAYQLSFNFIRRRFEIEKGSTITWTGEPTTGQLDVKAIYIANTSPIDLVEDQLSASTPELKNTYLQKLPFQVHLNLTGELLKPIVAFDILLPENRNYGVSNDIVAQVQGRLDQLRQDEGEVNKQVFSLLLLNRFVNENPFASSGPGFSAGTYARQSVSRLLTEQLNDLGANLIQGVDLNFDLQSTEDYTTGERRNRTDLNVGLSKRLLNDRLKISIGSEFALEGPQQANQRSSNIAGNIAADYQLTQDGRYLVRFFRRNQYEGVVDGYIIENGISFILSVDYNRFREIFTGRRIRKQQQERAAADSTNSNR